MSLSKILAYCTHINVFGSHAGKQCRKKCFISPGEIPLCRDHTPERMEQQRLRKRQQWEKVKTIKKCENDWENSSSENYSFRCENSDTEDEKLLENSVKPQEMLIKKRGRKKQNLTPKNENQHLPKMIKKRNNKNSHIKNRMIKRRKVEYEPQEHVFGKIGQKDLQNQEKLSVQKISIKNAKNDAVEVTLQIVEQQNDKLKNGLNKLQEKFLVNNEKNEQEKLFKKQWGGEIMRNGYNMERSLTPTFFKDKFEFFTDLNLNNLDLDLDNNYFYNVSFF